MYQYPTDIHWSSEEYSQHPVVGQRWYYVYPDQDAQAASAQWATVQRDDEFEEPAASGDEYTEEEAEYEDQPAGTSTVYDEQPVFTEYTRNVTSHRTAPQAPEPKANGLRATSDQQTHLEQLAALRRERDVAQADARAWQAKWEAVVKERDDLLNQQQAMQTEFESEMQQAEKEINDLQREKDKFFSERNNLEDALRQAQADFDELSYQFNALSVAQVQLPANPPVASGSTAQTTQQQYGESIQWGSPSQAGRPATSPNPPKAGRITPAPLRGKGEAAPPHKFGPPWAVRPNAVEASGVETTHVAPAPQKVAPLTRGNLIGYLGMNVEIRENEADDGIIFVRKVAPSSLAEKSGIRVNDIIEKWNRRAITTSAEWFHALEATTPHSTLRIGLLRQGLRKQALINLE